MRLEVLTAVRMMLFLWDLTPRKLVGGYQLFIFSPEDGNSMFLRSVGIYPRVYTASELKTTTLSHAFLSTLFETLVIYVIPPN
jgi:hypothetical protein